MANVRRLTPAVTALLLVMASVVSAHAGGETGSRRRWVAHVPQGEEAYALAVAPNGSRVYVTGGGDPGPDVFWTAAHDAATGASIWAVPYTSPWGESGQAEAIGVSPDGSIVFVTGTALGPDGSDDYFTLAYDSADGTQLWIAQYSGAEEGSHDFSHLLTVDPGGARVYVSGASAGAYATIAYDEHTGAELWLARYEGLENDPSGLQTSPDGSRVFVTGSSFSKRNDYVTVAYDASMGTELWVARFNSRHHRGDTAYDLAVSPDGSRVFVTGCTGFIDECAGADAVTLAYDAATGRELWRARFDSNHGIDAGKALGVSPDGGLVYMAATSEGFTSEDMALLAYDAATGAELWRGVFNGPGDSDEGVSDLVVSPDGRKILVTGVTYFYPEPSDIATVAFSAGTGRRLWYDIYDDDLDSWDSSTAIGISPDGSSVYVTGDDVGSDGYEFTTIAYRT